LMKVKEAEERIARENLGRLDREIAEKDRLDRISKEIESEKEKATSSQSTTPQIK